ncbi:MAG: hypothetical protein NC213_09420 [Acetobacter sp.]|nr:hypothetical protein [Bacteroides sp.]MCM1341949.1 hypothetical protein [Acetobacter sp.]MCM1434133.1 hypothetical protein [Clostridiales bacterium]
MTRRVSLIVSVVSMFFGIILFFISFFKSYSSAELTLIDNINGLCLIYVLRYISLCLVLFGVSLLLYLIVLRVKKYKVNKCLLSVLTIIFITFSIISVVLPISNYSSNIQFGENVISDTIYKDMLPYYNDMNKMADNSLYLSVEKNKIFSTEYLEIQSFCDFNDETVLYDVKYCKSKSRLVLWQFTAENTMLLDYEITDYGNFNNTSYRVYKNNDSKVIMISSDESYCVFNLCNINATEQNDFVEDIYSVYENIKQAC